MAGYKGFSMSNNAVEAYESGEMPLSKWTKAEMLEAAEKTIKADELKVDFNFELLKKVKVADLKRILLIKSSWHHTSSRFNKTDFYTIDADSLESLTNADLERLIGKKTTKKEEPKIEKWECRFREKTGGTLKHPKYEFFTEIGEIKGNWFYREDGSKKSIYAKGFCKIRKVS